MAFEREEGEGGRVEDADARAGGGGRLRERVAVDDGGGELAGDGALGGGGGGLVVREVADEVDDVVGGGREADVGGVVGIVGGEEDQRAGAGVLLASVDGDFEVALRDEEDLFPGVAMDGVRVTARRLVDRARLRVTSAQRIVSVEGANGRVALRAMDATLSVATRSVPIAVPR